MFARKLPASPIHVDKLHLIPAVMMRQTISLRREDVTDDMLLDAAALFSENYGIWGQAAAGGKPGKFNFTGRAVDDPNCLRRRQARQNERLSSAGAESSRWVRQHIHSRNN